MILIILMLIIMFVLWCCLRMASIADNEMMNEKIENENKTYNDNKIYR